MKKIKKNKLKCLGLIPTRLGAKRLPSKPLLEIKKLPLIIHTYRRAKLSNKLDDLVICCDHKKIYKVAKQYNAKVRMTSIHHKNGTERIAEAYLKNNKKYDFVLDIQGDEPLIDPKHINKIIEFHNKNNNVDIVLPTLKIKNGDNPNIVKVVVDKKNNVLYLSRNQIPFEYKKKSNFFLKHLSVISFKPSALLKFAKYKNADLEKIEGIELLRAIEMGLKIKTVILKGDSFSVDIKDDYLKAKQYMDRDKYFKFYCK